MKGYMPVSTSDPDDRQVFDYSSPFDWSQSVQNDKYKSIFKYNSASLTLDVDYLNTDRIKEDAVAKTTRFLIIFCCYLFLFVTAPFTIWFYLKRISQTERIVLFRLGRLQPILGSGITCFLPWIDRWQIVDLRMREFSIPPQQLIMADGGIIEVGCEVRYRVADVIKSVTSVKNLDHSLRLLAQTSMVSTLQNKTLSEFQNEKGFVSTKLQNDLNAATRPWGLEISRVEISPPKVIHAGEERSPVGPLLSSLQSVLSVPHPPMETRVQGSENVVPTKRVKLTARNVMLNKVFPTFNEGSYQSDSGAVYKVVITGDDGGTFWLDTKMGKTAEGEEAPPDFKEPDMTIKLPGNDFVGFVDGKLSPFQIYMSGHLQITGDIRLLNDLQGFLKLQK